MSVTFESPAALSHYSQAYLAEYIGYRVIAVAVTFIALETVFVVLRSVARRKIPSPLGWDDYLIIPALVANIGICVHGIIMVHVTGAGHHLPAVILQHGPAKLVVWSKCIYASIWIYSIAVVLPKMSILCLYLRIFVQKPHRIATYVLMGVLISHGIASVFAATFECTPLAHLWDKTIAGHCFNAVAFYRLASLPNIITDVLMLCLPMPMIWQLKLSTARKISLTFVFLTGSIGIFASCIRAAIFFRTNALQDSTWSSVDLIVWSIVEPGTYLIAACLPALRTLVNHNTIDSLKSRFTKKSTSGHSADQSDPSVRRAGFARLQSKDPRAPHNTFASEDDDAVPMTSYGVDEEKGVISSMDRAKLGGHVQVTPMF